MNTQIRKYLIDQCRIGNPIYYEDVAKKLNLNLSLDKDRSILSKTLGEISTYEFQNERPLISAIAIYKKDNDHGNGFYSLCEDLGIGTIKKLREQYFGFTALEKAKDFWQNDDLYNQYYNIDIHIYNEIKDPFFTQEEVLFFSRWADKVYDKNNPDDFNAKEYILNSVWKKTKFWSEELNKRLKGYEVSNNRRWGKRGWDNGSAVSKFKPYTWARIYKKGDYQKNIFFTVGIDAFDKSIVYKLDYYHESDSTLSVEQKEICNKYIPATLRWNAIPHDKISNWNWSSLIKLTADFIFENDHHYDRLIEMAWGETKIENVFTDHLTKRARPNSTLNELPKLNPTFKGVDTDFIQKNIEDKELGDLGEELVRLYEILILENKGLKELSKNVCIVPDGKGFDILSFFDNGTEKYIEVKTTRQGEKTPFNLSINEKLFAEKNNDNYVIYRLYNYNEEKNTSDFFEITNIEDELLLQTTEFRAYIKMKD
ncbi:hypothetical protein CMU59_09625 [Elizabethkingia anophelis]|uniref:DUF3883 domain-containing protein n=1 Tax=Elizabethkingia anophelis TaxID=1117645 RepID=UPI002010EB9C|nr:DUF3883 domain-containing protein [Elizabethkingia anophelis]MCL1690088.1 DUF3883 domain-containing protein [Elizabethkingia anophelis]MDV3572885.1 hypothetical protein [Elizabethkingia anophelis]MDV3599797.1 hypothetical protein [Elizabethkingia anophelis]MDV3605717.1 hypothetical protein [Elizabethkingia anophelis]MDV3638900.1 hypothetical protein [Elizabethkingia anophelis]